VVAIFLLVAFAMQTFENGLIVLNYYTNAASFARDCENKARPQLHCNGKCQLLKKLKQQENKDQQNSGRKAENKIGLFYASSFFATAVLLPHAGPPTFSICRVEKTADHTGSVFHPPSRAILA
jgi:hypothetical protein